MERKDLPMKRYCIVGTGGRGTWMYADRLKKNFADCAELVGVYDINYKRCQKLIEATGWENCVIYRDFDEMIAKAKPDVVIVTTVDAFHHEYIVRALDLGCDVISEKPLTTDEVKYKAIVEAEKRNNKKVTVTFNLRFMPFFARIKSLLKNEDLLGDIFSVHYEWYLDTSHGADYFRRWHRYRKNSGSLLVHKSTHHFDIANWFLEQDPVAVNAFGTRRFYGPTREQRGERCLTCPYKKTCEFYKDITVEGSELKNFYYDCEDVDGYYRDRCVFADDIDIEDSVSVNVKYSGGTVMSYSLTAHSPYEGFRLVLNGKKGRLVAEHLCGIGFYNGKDIYNLTFYNRYGEKIDYNQPIGSADGHGGGDIRLLEMIIRGGMEDPLGQVADSRAGAMSIMIGIAANHSMAEGRQIQIADLMGE